MRWMHWVALLTIPLVTLPDKPVGWLPNVAVNRGLSGICFLHRRLSPSWMSALFRLLSFIFLFLFTVMLIAEIGIMIRAIKKGPEV